MRSSRREPWERGCFFSILDLGEGEDGSKFPSILSKTVAFLVACVQTSPISFVARVQQKKIGDVCMQATFLAVYLPTRNSRKERGGALLREDSAYFLAKHLKAVKTIE